MLWVGAGGGRVSLPGQRSQPGPPLGPRGALGRGLQGAKAVTGSLTDSRLRTSEPGDL